ncbi:DUF6270 domain-containing protein [Comamonas kerstersii]|uniref:DUF6270 domain-containing protein n=1 Tax=Comamonas kerstersii TaxID=225992 RepID=UPI00345CCC72
MKVFIFGSCVSRDILNFDNGEAVELVDYYARSSFASLAGSSCEVGFEDLNNIKSDFQKRMVYRDLNKLIFGGEAVLDLSSADCILIDLIDERFDILELASGAFVTLSSELLSSNLIDNKFHKNKKIPSGSERHRELWKIGINKFLNFLKDNKLINKLLVNEVYWSLLMSNGDSIAERYSLDKINYANNHLRWMYSFLRKNISGDRFIKYPDYLFRSCDDHRWGFSPFHYHESVYKYGIEYLIKNKKTNDRLDFNDFPKKLREEILSINSVDIELSENILKAVIESDAIDVKFAFYVFRNEERVHVQWYSDENVLNFDTKGMNGLYRVYGFIKTVDNKVCAKYSKPYFLNPITFTQLDPVLVLKEKVAINLADDNWVFPALFYPGEKRRLFVLTSGATDRSKINLPYFNRWTWANKGIFPGYSLCVSDPTLALDKSIDLGWYLGTCDKDATESLARLIKLFANSLDISSNDIVIWGSSGGGFAALALAASIDGATAVAINAQTDALQYHVKDAVDKVRMVCFADSDDISIRESYNHRINMEKKWLNNRNSKIVLIQNTLDEHHYKMHFKPFWSALTNNSQEGVRVGNYFSYIYEDVKGHAPESEDMVSKILEFVDSMQANPVAL